MFDNYYIYISKITPMNDNDDWSFGAWIKPILHIGGVLLLIAILFYGCRHLMPSISIPL